jgi:uncharacterized protein YjlB
MKAGALQALKELPAGQITTHSLLAYGDFPNNRWPLLVYHGAVTASGQDPAALFEQLFTAHQWVDCWRNGIYDYHHYHSTTHEVLGIYSGSAKVQFGGPEGVVLEVREGDVVVIPAGVAHKNRGSSNDFGVVGAYPEGYEPDMNYGTTDERPHADQRISSVPVPLSDPVYGDNGPIFRLWAPAQA